MDLVKQRSLFNFLKGLAIICVVIAHTNVLNGNSIIVDRFLNPLFGNIGLLGVPVFFLLSGYFYFNNSQKITVIIKNKIKTIIVPWIFCSSLVFIASSFSGEQLNTISYFSYIKFVVGYGSIYYYLTVLFIFYIVFFFIKSRIEVYILPIIIANFLMIIQTEYTQIYPYLNPLNWILFFALGIIINKYQVFIKLTNFFRNHNIIVFLCFTCFLIYNTWLFPINKSVDSYFDITSLVFELFSICFFMSLKVSNNYINQFIEYLGKVSFTIYLTHLPIAGFVNVLFNRFSIPFILVKPLIVLVLFIIIYRIILYIDSRIRYARIGLLLGFRRR